MLLSGAHREAAEVRIGQHRAEQENAKEKLHPIRAPSRVEDANVDDPVDHRAEEDTEGRAIAAAEKNAADDSDDDRLEDVAKPGGGVAGMVFDALDDSNERSRDAGGYEQYDLNQIRRHAGATCGDRIAARRIDPVSECRARQDDARRRRNGDPPQDRDVGLSP